MDRNKKAALSTLQKLMDKIYKDLSECFTPGRSTKHYIHQVAIGLVGASDEIISISNPATCVYTGKKIDKLASIIQKLRQIAKACIDNRYEVAIQIRNEIMISLK